MHPTSNQQVFDTTVQELLTKGGVAVIDQDVIGLLQALEHGEGSVDTALNLVVRAHMAHMLLHVSMPFAQDPWSEYLLATEPRIKRGLEACHELLRRAPLPKGVVLNLWAIYVPMICGLDAWDNLRHLDTLRGDVGKINAAFHFGGRRP